MLQITSFDICGTECNTNFFHLFQVTNILGFLYLGKIEGKTKQYLVDFLLLQDYTSLIKASQ